MRLAARVPGGIEGKCAFSVRASHQRRSAARLPPTVTAAIDFHISRCLYLIARAARNGSRMLTALGSHAQFPDTVAGCRDARRGAERLLTAVRATRSGGAPECHLRQRVEVAHRPAARR